MIVEVAGKPITTVSELLTNVAGLKPGAATKFRVQRRDDAMELNVTPGKRPKPRQLQQQQPR